MKTQNFILLVGLFFAIFIACEKDELIELQPVDIQVTVEAPQQNFNWDSLGIILQNIFAQGFFNDTTIIIFPDTIGISLTEDFNFEIEINNQPQLIFVKETLLEDSCKSVEMFVNDSIIYSKIFCKEIITDTITEIVTDTIIKIERDTIIIRDTIEVEVHDTIESKPKKIIRESFFEKCNNPGNSSFYKLLGWIFNEFFSINQLGSDSGKGTLVYEGTGKDTIWSPELFSEPMSVDTLSFYLGSKNPFEIQIALRNSSGEVLILDKVKTSENNDFDWQKLSSYKLFNYCVSLENLELHNIVRMGFIVKNLSSKKCTGRNYQLNIDNIFVRGVKIIEPIGK